MQLAYFIAFHGYLHPLQVSMLYREGLKVLFSGSLHMSRRYLILLVDFPAFIAVFHWQPQLAETLRAWSKKTKRRIFLCCGVGLLLSLTPLLRFGANLPLWLMRSGESWTVKYFGTIGNSLIQIYQIGSQEQAASLFEYGRNIEQDGVVADAPPSFVVIQLESVDAHAVELNYRGDAVMPFLDSLTRHSVYYKYMLSAHGAGATSDIDFTVLNGMCALGTVPSLGLTTYDFPNSFIHQLRPVYGKAVAFHNNKRQYFNRESAYLKMGFDTLFDPMLMKLKEVGWGAPDHAMFSYISSRLADEIAPFYYHIITMSCHEPYTNVLRYYTDKRLKTIDNRMLRNYLTSLAYVDRELRTFIASVQRVVPDAVIIIYGDHCPPYLTERIDPNVFVSATAMVDGIRYEFVPLVIITPDGTVSRTDNWSATMLDIAPTILYASGLPFTYRSNGFNLLDSSVKPDTGFHYGKMFNRRELLKQARDQWQVK